MHANLVSVVPHLLHLLIVGVLMRNVESRLDVAAIRVFALRRKQFLGVQIPVLDVDRIVEREYNHLRHLRRLEAARNDGAVLGAEAIGQRAGDGITRFGRVRIVVHVAPSLVGAVRTVDGTVAKILVRQTRSVAATEMIGLLALGVGEQRLGHTGLCVWADQKKGGD